MAHLRAVSRCSRPLVAAMRDGSVEPLYSQTVWPFFHCVAAKSLATQLKVLVSWVVSYGVFTNRNEPKSCCLNV